MNLVINESQPLWEYLRCAEKPVVLYGMGDGAPKILAVCRQYGIPIAGIFASDEFVRGHSFEGYPVESLAQIEKRLGDFIVLLCFGVDYDPMLERIAELSRRHEPYAPDIPVFGSDLFTPEYFREHQAEFEQVYGLLADDESRQIYADLLAYKLSGKLEYLYRHMGSREEDFGSILTPAPGVSMWTWAPMTATRWRSLSGTARTTAGSGHWSLTPRTSGSSRQPPGNCPGRRWCPRAVTAGKGSLPSRPGADAIRRWRRAVKSCVRWS